MFREYHTKSRRKKQVYVCMHGLGGLPIHHDSYWRFSRVANFSAFFPRIVLVVIAISDRGKAQKNIPDDDELKYKLFPQFG